MFMSQADAKHFLDDSVRAIILHHPVAYDPFNPVPKFEPPDFAKKYGKVPEGEYPDDTSAMTHFAMMSAEAKRELLLSYASDLYEMLDEEMDPKPGYQADAEVDSEIALMVSWIVLTVDYALGMGETFRDVRRFYQRAPLHGCAPIDVPARRFPDTNQAEPLSHYPLGATSMRAALAQGGLYAEERAQARDPSYAVERTITELRVASGAASPSPALEQVISQGGAAVLAFPEEALPPGTHPKLLEVIRSGELLPLRRPAGSESVFSEVQSDQLSRLMNGGPVPTRAIANTQPASPNDTRGILHEFGMVDAQYTKFR